MKTSLKASLSSKKTLLILSVICIVFGGVCLVLGGLGEFLLPVVIATLAAIYVFDKKRTYAIITSGILMAFNLAGILFEINISFFGLAAIVSAGIIAIAYYRGQSKSDAAFLSTIIYAFLSVCGMLLLAMFLIKNFDFNAAMDFWDNIYDSSYEAVREMLDKYLTLAKEYYTEAEVNYAREVSYLLLDISFSCVISYIVIAAFAVIGLSMKLFGFIVKKCAEDNSEITKWRFATSNVYAYFYLALSLATVFVSSVDNIFGIAVANLYFIFLIVYAYVGFTSILSLLKQKLRPILAYIIVIAACLLMLSLSPQILAFVGVFSTFTANRRLKEQND